MEIMELVFNIAIGLVWGLAATVLVATAIQSVNTDGEFRYWNDQKNQNAGGWKFAGLNTLGALEWFLAAMVGLVLWASWSVPPYVAPTEAAWVSLALYILMTVVFICLMVYGGREVSSILEVLPFLALSGLFWGHLYHAGLYAVVVADAFWSSVILVLPPILFTISVALWFTTWLFYRVSDVDEPESNAKTRDHILAWVVIIVKLIITILLAVFCVVKPALALGGPTVDQAYADEVKEEAQKDLTVEEFTWEDLENLTLTKYASVSKVLDDSSLTPHDADRTKKAGFSDALAYPFSEFAEIEESNMRNPSYLKTLCDFFKDKQIGNKKVGDLNPWMRIFSETTEKHGIFIWCEWADENRTVINVTDDYRRYGAMMNTFLERFVIQGKQQRTTVENWCLNITSLNNSRWGVPASYQYDGEFLVLAWIGKNERGNAQATGLFVFGFNTSDRRPAIFGHKPEVVTVTGTPDGNPGNPGNSDNPNPGPGPNPDGNPQKRPEELMAREDYTNSNDDTGPGERTIGEDPNHSTRDTSDSSTSMDHSQYRDDMDQKNEANNGSQREAGESDEPTTKSDPGTTVDNAGGEAANHGGTVANEASTADGSAATKSEKSGGDGAWGGPTD